ncbi:hypothetical protein SIPHO063v1_p0002 [Vibrio phage PS10B.1]|nr:hypothetical protein SIPHO063v1_p0002 [Vibrio phage PS10B.1]
MIFNEYNTGRTYHKSTAFGSRLTVAMFTSNIRENITETDDMPRRLTTEEFIEKAQVTHGDRYSYGRAVYVRSTGKITITCHEHGDFEQEACSHLQGAGCAKCSGNAKLTTEDFIEQAREVHGDRYGYDRSIYTSTMKKIIITCPEHGYFLQTPDNHLHGSGCVKCATTSRSLARRLTTEEFIEKARAVHSDRYGYERAVYMRARDKITITCHEHGDFLQTPADHLSGKGCIKCGTLATSLVKTLTTEAFIGKARLVHGSKYNYGRTDYIRNSYKITITCPNHGDFSQLPCNHLAGKGCIKCSGKYSPSTEEFVEKAREVHSDSYSYKRTVYASARGKIIITCPEHGDFEQTPGHHLKGKGCLKCAESRRRLTTEDFINKARTVHGSRYDYVRSAYTRGSDKIIITCPEHGDFLQEPHSHLKGKGCINCSVTGFNSDKQAYLYILLDVETYSRVKIGVSTVPDKRLSQLKRDTPFTLERIDLFETPPWITMQIEKFCHSQLDSANLSGFDGATEWFKFDGGKLEALRTFIRSCGGVTVLKFPL